MCQVIAKQFIAIILFNPFDRSIRDSNHKTHFSGEDTEAQGG